MPITIKDIAEMFSKDVFTNKGFYCGKISDLEFDLTRYKIRAIVIETAKNSLLGQMIGGKKGVIIPYPMVQAVGDIVIIKHMTGTTLPETESEEAA